MDDVEVTYHLRNILGYWLVDVGYGRRYRTSMGKRLATAWTWEEAEKVARVTGRAWTVWEIEGSAKVGSVYPEGRDDSWRATY